MLRGRCECRAVSFDVADAFTDAFNCHCSNCRALSGSAFLSFGEIARHQVRVTTGEGGLLTQGDPGADYAVRCASCLSLVLWTVGRGARARVPYGTLVDAPQLKPTAHIFVGSKASWHDILDDLPQHQAGPAAGSEVPTPDDVAEARG